VLETLKTSLQNNELEEFRIINKALEMLENGMYGECVECEQDISERRLMSYPNATRCLACQEIFETGGSSQF
jgi:DnaK suppressor protein